MGSFVDAPTMEQLYLAGHEAILEVIRSAPPSAADAVVPACAPWTVRELLSHLAGICADVLSGNLDGVATDRWTAAQVDARRDRSLTELVDEWTESAPRFASLLDNLPGWYPWQPVGDLTIHEHDVRGALGCPAPGPTPALVRTVEFLLCTRAHAVAVVNHLGVIEVRADEHRWTIGTGAPPDDDVDAVIDKIMLTGESPPPPVEAPRVTVSGSLFELSRALTGRRSAKQLRELRWEPGFDGMLELFCSPPFTARTSDLDDNFRFDAPG